MFANQHNERYKNTIYIFVFLLVWLRKNKKMQRYKLFIQYMGTKYNGWQRQSNSHRTVQQVLEDAVQRVLFVHPSQAGKSLVSKQDTGSASAQFIQEQQKNIEIVGSSRTDTGVHALCTTAHIDLHRKHRITGETVLYIGRFY